MSVTSFGPLLEHRVTEQADGVGGHGLKASVGAVEPAHAGQYFEPHPAVAVAAPDGAPDAARSHPRPGVRCAACSRPTPWTRARGYLLGAGPTAARRRRQPARPGLRLRTDRRDPGPPGAGGAGVGGRRERPGAGADPGQRRRRRPGQRHRPGGAGRPGRRPSTGCPTTWPFAALWSNPPIRVGKAALHALLLDWLGRLSRRGEACLVVHKHLGADSLAAWLNRSGLAHHPLRVPQRATGSSTSPGAPAVTVRNLTGTELKRLHRDWRRRSQGRLALLLDGVQTPYNVGHHPAHGRGLPGRPPVAGAADRVARPPEERQDGAGLAALPDLDRLDRRRPRPPTQVAASGYALVGLELADGAVPLHELDLAARRVPGRRPRGPRPVQGVPGPLRRGGLPAPARRDRIAQRGRGRLHRHLRGPPPGLDRALTAAQRPYRRAEGASGAEGVDGDAEATGRAAAWRPGRRAAARARRLAAATGRRSARATSTPGRRSQPGHELARRRRPTPWPARPAAGSAAAGGEPARPRPPGAGSPSSAACTTSWWGRRVWTSSRPLPAPPTDEPAGQHQQRQRLLGRPVARRQQLLVEVQEGHHVGRPTRCSAASVPDEHLGGGCGSAGHLARLGPGADLDHRTPGQRLELLAHPGHAGPEVLEAGPAAAQAHLRAHGPAAAAHQLVVRRPRSPPRRTARSGPSRRSARRPAARPGPCG